MGRELRRAARPCHRQNNRARFQEIHRKAAPVSPKSTCPSLPAQVYPSRFCLPTRLPVCSTSKRRVRGLRTVCGAGGASATSPTVVRQHGRIARAHGAPHVLFGKTLEQAVPRRLTHLATPLRI